MAVTKEQLRNALNVLKDFRDHAEHVYKVLALNGARKALNCTQQSHLTVEFLPNPFVTMNEIDWNLDKVNDVIYNNELFDQNADIFFMSKKELDEWLKLYQEQEKIKQSDEYKKYLELKEKYSSIDR